MVDREALGNMYDMDPKKVNCGRCRYFGFNNYKAMTCMGDSSCLFSKKRTNKLLVCNEFNPVNPRVGELFKKVISFDVLIHNKSEDLYIPCEGKLLSTLPSRTGLGYKVKVEKVLSTDTPYHLKSRLLTSSYVYVKEREIEEYAKIVEEK